MIPRRRKAHIAEIVDEDGYAVRVWYDPVLACLVFRRKHSRKRPATLFLRDAHAAAMGQGILHLATA